MWGKPWVKLQSITPGSRSHAKHRSLITFAGPESVVEGGMISGSRRRCITGAISPRRILAAVSMISTPRS